MNTHLAIVLGSIDVTERTALNCHPLKLHNTRNVFFIVIALRSGGSEQRVRFDIQVPPLLAILLENKDRNWYRMNRLGMLENLLKDTVSREVNLEDLSRGLLM